VGEGKEWQQLETVMTNGMVAKKLRVGQMLKVKAQALSPNGQGVVAEHVPAQIHVRNLLPSEEATVVVRHVSSHGGPAHADVSRRHSCAEARVVPSCASFGPCGGCAVLHMSYSAQLAWKTACVKTELAAVQVSVNDCVAAPFPSDYRCRVKLVATSHPVRKVMLGAFAPRSHQVLDMAGCETNRRSLMLVAKTVAEEAAKLAIAPYDEESAVGSLRYVLLREVASGQVQVSLVLADRPQQVRALADAIAARHPAVSSITLHRNASRGNALLPAPTPFGERQPETNSGLEKKSLSEEEKELGSTDDDEIIVGDKFLWEELTVPLRVSARSFLQVNREVAKRMYSEAARQLAHLSFDTVLDLYCGVSGLGLTVLRDHPDARLFGIELGASAIADAEASAAALGFSPPKANFFVGKVEEVLPSLQAMATFGRTAAIINPPRRGCSEEALSALCHSAPSHIIYMSCSPASLARDLQYLIARGYVAKLVMPFDMHPGTQHIECLAVLERK
jgi:23S rRNA (uracil1939-C5)-methyltransferase